MVQVNTQLTRQDFLRFNFSHFFSNLFIKILLGIFGFVAFMSLFGFIMIILTDNDNASPFEQLMPVLIILAIFGLICGSVYSQSNRNYTSTSTVHEPIVYTFSDTGMHIKGKSFESDLNWNIIHKVKETKELFLFYQNNMAANLVPKSAFTSQEQISALRELIASQPNLKHKLRKD
ncbi:YcxB family protein [Pontibacter ruber]|uniref:YcxB family protein n=1 Tax=Pontibacter ruber TaxID=1343895 RepID=A0ABW5CTX1_9BACT|nr:YcxB family protein [Pontibacter ruber]